ncbi:hypothetical protein [Glaciimonas sp. PAMC28666]|uniref:hypothetical protein n=1 Tax=Glaciimonas sp. PAMC28666 TaxID=2807626 RepID=UPI00196295DE|nr:hypothetical protein [Glaciimonas sp. PAMC28666]QRX80829.1 hypothetical protein JQN73_11355 [Glaciimonas sp. PAMC28666]
MLKPDEIPRQVKKSGVVRVPKVPKLKLVKPIEKKIWPTLTREACLKSIKTASHLSSKSINSNASAVGIRVSSAERLSLPFVAISTLDSARIPVDYVLGATDAGPLKQITSILDKTCDDLFTNIDPEQRAMVEQMGPLMLSAASVGTGFIDPRLRQVLWPSGEKSMPWIALTPLQSSGLSEAIRNRLVIEKARHINQKNGKSSINRRDAILGIGGSNPQNVGRYVRSMQRPLVFDAPKEDRSVRLAYALHFKGHLRGLAFAAPYKETLAFALWRHGMRNANAQAMPSNAAIRLKEVTHIHAIACAALAAAASARHILEQNLEHINGLTTPTLDPFLRAMIDPTLRDRNFKKDFARKLISSIERFKFKDGKNEYVVSGDGELSALISDAEEVVG